MDVKDAEAGVWYQHEKYGKVLCCGSRDPEHYNGFVTHHGAGTSLRFLRDDEVVTKSLIQSWDAEPETPPLRPISGESTAKNVNEAMSIGEMVGESLKEFSDRLEAEAKQPTGNGSQLESGSSPALTDIGLRVDRHGNVVFRPELGDASYRGI